MAYQQAKSDLKSLQEQWQLLIRERDFVQFQIEELAQLDLEKTNYDALIDELRELEHAEVLIQNTSESIQILEQTDGVLLSLNRIKNNMQKIAAVSKVAAGLLERIEVVDIEIKDILAEMESFAESITIDPKQMDFLNNKLESFQKALRKHQLENQEQLTSFYKQLL